MVHRRCGDRGGSRDGPLLDRTPKGVPGTPRGRPGQAQASRREPWRPLENPGAAKLPDRRGDQPAPDRSMAGGLGQSVRDHLDRAQPQRDGPTNRTAPSPAALTLCRTNSACSASIGRLILIPLSGRKVRVNIVNEQPEKVPVHHIRSLVSVVAADGHQYLFQREYGLLRRKIDNIPSEPRPLNEYIIGRPGDEVWCQVPKKSLSGSCPLRSCFRLKQRKEARNKPRVYRYLTGTNLGLDCFAPLDMPTNSQCCHCDDHGCHGCDSSS